MCNLLIYAPIADFLERLHLPSVLLVMDDASLSLAANPLLLVQQITIHTALHTSHPPKSATLSFRFHLG